MHVKIDGTLKDRKHCLQGVFAVALDVELIVQVQCPQQVAGDRRWRGDTFTGLCIEENRRRCESNRTLPPARTKNGAPFFIPDLQNTTRLPGSLA